MKLKVQPAPCITHCDPLLSHFGVMIAPVLFSNYKKSTVHGNETYIPC